MSQSARRQGPGLAAKAIAGLLVFWVILLVLIEARAQDRQPVALELVLLVDVSASVSDQEFGLQAAGLSAALSSPEVLEAIVTGSPGGIALAVIQWADQESQGMAVDWAHLRSDLDVLRYAARIGAMPRLFDSGSTAISSALAAGLQELETNRFDGLRRVLDVSGDGRNNDGFRLGEARRRVLAAGVTINGLPILNELPFLDRYFRDYLIGGAGAFYIVADDYSDFAEAMKQKLWREIRAVPVTRAPYSPQGQSAESAAARASGAGLARTIRSPANQSTAFSLTSPLPVALGRHHSTPVSAPRTTESSATRHLLVEQPERRYFDSADPASSRASR